MLTTHADRLGLDVANVKTDVVGHPGGKAVVESTCVAQSNEVRGRLVSGHHIDDGSRDESSWSGQATEGDDHQAKPPTSCDASSGTWKITPTRPIAWSARETALGSGPDATTSVHSGSTATNCPT